MTRRVAVVGSGVLGRVLRAAHAALGDDVASVGGRELKPVEALRTAEAIWIAVPDRAIASVAARLAELGAPPAGSLVLHTSGFHASTELAPLAARGATVGSAHPLQSFADPAAGAEALEATRWFVEGDDPERISSFVERLGGRATCLEASAKPLYHAAAAIASNGLVTVIDLALAVAEAAGIERADALDALRPLVEGSVANVARVGLPDALTGPIARGDIETVRGHVDALARIPEIGAIYAALGRHTVDIAQRRGLDPEIGRRLLEELKRFDPPGDRA